MGRGLSRSPSAQAGVSLIELLVVVAVLAILAVGVTLVPLGRGALSDMARFRQAHDTQRALAIAGRGSRGLEITPQHMVRLDPGLNGWRRSRAQPWRDRVVFAGAGPASGGPAIRFSPDGRSAAFSITFGAGGRCESDGWSGLTCEGL